MRTRSGETIGLAELLNEAIERAGAIVAEKRPELGGSEARRSPASIGLGAVKYAELSQHRMTDYTFSWSKMLSFRAIPLPIFKMPMCASVRSFRKLEGEFAVPDELVLAAAEERALAVKLLQFGEVIPLVLDDFRPNLLANYLYDLAIVFHAFYEACPVHEGRTAESRAARLVLCDVTARVLQEG